MSRNQEKKASTSKALTKAESPAEDTTREPSQKAPKSFTIAVEGVNEIAQCLNDVNLNKHLKQALFNVLNEHLKPVFD